MFDKDADGGSYAVPRRRKNNAAALVIRMSANNTSIMLANQKYVSISIFQGKFYFHISDLRKAKSISLKR